MRIFFWSFLLSAAALIAAFIYGGPTALLLCLILGVLEVSLSFDNAVVNATILDRMSEFWQRIFLTIGIVIAVFGMRLLFPLLIVQITAGLDPVEAFRLAMAKGDVETPGSYGYLLAQAHPQIAAFGGMFLLMLFLSYMFTSREITWLSWLEKPLARIGKLDQLPVVLAGLLLVVVAQTMAPEPSTVLIAGLLGMVVYIVVNGLGELFHRSGSDDDRHDGPGALVKATGKAGFFLFLYLEVLDASFSFDGVIGAFAITSDPVIIALGLGVIGALFVRSLTIYLVHKGTLHTYVYLEHGAHWAIGALAVILLISIGAHIPEVVTGLIGVAFIGASFVSSLLRRRRFSIR